MDYAIHFGDCKYWFEIDRFVFRYVDSNYVGDLDKCRSTIGYVFTMAKGAKGQLSWLCILQ